MHLHQAPLRFINMNQALMLARTIMWDDSRKYARRELTKMLRDAGYQPIISILEVRDMCAEDAALSIALSEAKPFRSIKINRDPTDLSAALKHYLLKVMFDKYELTWHWNEEFINMARATLLASPEWEKFVLENETQYTNKTTNVYIVARADENNSGPDEVTKMVIVAESTERAIDYAMNESWGDWDKNRNMLKATPVDMSKTGKIMQEDTFV